MERCSTAAWQAGLSGQMLQTSRLFPKASKKAREISVENSREYSRAEPAEPRTELDRKLSTLPSQRGEMMRRGPAGAGFSAKPLVDRVRGALGLKKGGLSTMPRGKK